MRKIKRFTPLALIACMAFSILPLSGCAQEQDENVLRIASWDEYIDEGGEDSYVEGSAPLYEEFVEWYKETYGKEIAVEYVTIQDNETMYNKIRMGDSYDILCPSEYMIMKLAEEDLLQKLPQSFFNTNDENNYYARFVSPYIQGVFDEGKMNDGSKWSEYIAGYMWGSTGFVYNPEKVSRETVDYWNVFNSQECARRISAKDNVRDSYFAALGILHETELLGLQAQLNEEKISLQEYKTILSQKMNDTSAETISNIRDVLMNMRQNLYGLETDEGKLDIITGRFDVSYQWSGDAVYTMDMGEEATISSEPQYLEYCIPKAASNLWFDGWVLMKNSKNVDAATAFINFISMPENVIRNMYYIGYTSCIAGEDVYAYVEETYGDEEGDATHNLSYFFGEDHLLTTTEDQTKRQLFAQYPDQDTINRLVVMNYFDKETNEKINRMWNIIK